MPWSPESRAKAAERMRKLNADPEFKEKLSKLHADPAFKEAAAERMRKLNADPAFKEKHHFLADLSDEQRKLYHKLRSNGLGRDEALAEVKRSATSLRRSAAE
jgi:hypothetical protein